MGRESFSTNDAYNAYQRAYRLKNKKKWQKYKREYNAQWRKEHGSNNSDYQRIAMYNTLFPERLRARQLVRYAVRKGELKKEPCILCTSKKVVAHHPNYSKPLEV
jgi:hypothetical protein